MTRLAWLSDLHFSPTARVLERDARSHLAAAVEAVNRASPDAEYCVLTGDLVEDPSDVAYSELRAALDDLAMPYLPLVGNHDDRDRLREHLPLPAGTASSFIQYTVDTPDIRIVCLDTQNTGFEGAAYCGDRVAWLESALGSAGDRPVLIAMHHPPRALGMPMLDDDCFCTDSVLSSTLGRFHGSIRYIMAGHVHRPISGTLHGIPFSTMRSVLYQAPPPRPAWTWETFAPAADSACFGLVTLESNDVTVHFIDIPAVS